MYVCVWLQFLLPELMSCVSFLSGRLGYHELRSYHGQVSQTHCRTLSRLCIRSIGYKTTSLAFYY